MDLLLLRILEKGKCWPSKQKWNNFFCFTDLSFDKLFHNLFANILINWLYYSLIFRPLILKSFNSSFFITFWKYEASWTNYQISSQWIYGYFSQLWRLIASGKQRICAKRLYTVENTHGESSFHMLSPCSNATNEKNWFNSSGYTLTTAYSDIHISCHHHTRSILERTVHQNCV